MTPSLHNPLVWLDDKFREYITDRRRDPRDDVLTELAAATYPDGSTPEVEEVVKLSTFLFAAGMETTTKLLSTAMRVIAERPDIQQVLRDDRAQIPVFLEEALRMESPVKSHFRLARTTTNIGDVKSQRAQSSCCCQAPAIAIHESLTIPTNSSTTAATCASTLPLVAAPTRARARRSLAPKAGSR